MKSFLIGRPSWGLKKKLTGSLFCLALLTLSQSHFARADEESGEDYYDPDLDADDLAERVAQMPDSSANQVDPVKKKKLLDKYGKKPFVVSVDSIEPEGGPTTGNTRVLVRGGPFQDLAILFPKPKCKFGKKNLVVDATYVLCQASPLGTEDLEGKHSGKTDYCLQCDNSPETTDSEIVPFSVSLLGDFSDSLNSVPYRYYKPTRVTAIYPRYGPKDGGSFIQVWGENFLNFGDNTRCNFGSKSVQAHFISNTFITCMSPFSDVVEKAIPFSVSMNKQQNSKEKIDYWYYNWPQVVELVPNYGPNSGGNRVIIKGNNFMPFNFTEDIDNSNDTFCIFEGIGKVRAYALNSTKVYCEAPPNYVTEKTNVEVTLNNQQYTDDNIPYFYYKPPQVFDADPREGPTRGGTEVVIFGAKFQQGKNITCKFGAKTTRGVFIDSNRISCVSPPVERAGYVPLSIAYEGEKYDSESIKYLYYDTPELRSFYPTCGPITGYTQITIEGKNFLDMGFGKAKCIFNNTYVMNATIMDSDVIKCDSPPLPEGMFISNGTQAPWYNISISLNGRENAAVKGHFTYYVDPIFRSITPNLGPLSGGTLSKIEGTGFAQEGVCNVTVRYGALTQKPASQQVSDSDIIVTSPEVEVPDAVVVSVSLNGQQFVKDYTLHFRDQENTFTYFQDILVNEFVPKNGPTSGKTKIRLTGMGFTQFKGEKGETKRPKIYARFRDYQSQNIIGEGSTPAFDVDDQGFSWFTPAADLDTKAIFEFSFNNKDWQVALAPGQTYSYSYYNAPKITSVNPKYGQVKSPNKEFLDINGRYFQCPDPECKDLWIKFGESKNAIYIKGERISDEKIRVAIPKYSKPDVLTVEATFNGQDYTHDNQTYGFFDPFVLQVIPRLISTKGTTKVRLNGFGFVNAGEDLKTQLSHNSRGQLSCAASQCFQQAAYIDKDTIESGTFPQSQITFKDNGESIKNNGMVIEASVTGGLGFTENGIEIWYYDQIDVLSLSTYGAPMNQEKSLFVKTDFKWNTNDVEQFKKYGIFTCRFSSRDGQRVVITKGKMEVYPVGSFEDNIKPTHIRCSSPQWSQQEEVKLDVSINGQEFFGDFPFTFYEGIDIQRIAPMAGPNEGKTRVKIFGTGFSNSLSKEDVFVKWGIVQTEKINKLEVLEYIWNENDYLSNTLLEGSENLIAYKKETSNTKKVDGEIKDRSRLKSHVSQSPKLPNWSKTHGGPMYMAAGENFQINRTVYHNLEDDDAKTYNGTTFSSDTIYHYSNSKVEFYYYQQPVVKKVEPSFGLVRGGTHIEISGAWFAYKPEYGVVPHCKIGNKVTRAQYFSTVRIVCISAPNDDINTLYPVLVSLNGIDFVDTGFTFRYFEQPKLTDMTPTSGPESGGTQIYIQGEKFSNISDPWNFKCRFSSNNRDIPPKYIPAYYVNKTSIMCSSPGGWGRGDSVRVQVTFNGEDYSENNFTFFYYNIVKAFPRSGPADGNGGPIRIEGSGFRNESELYCALDKVYYEPLSVQENLILCPMPKHKQGPSYFGNVDFAMIIDGNWHKFTGGFQYYEQVIIQDIYPKTGPSEGKGIIQVFGANFRDDYQLVDVGCKIGESLGKGKVIDKNTINCTVEEMPLVDEGNSLPITVALNSYSWPETNQTFVPYGITAIYPNSGPYTGNTDILITGKGFNEDFQEKAKCRFGIASDYAIVEAEILSYDKIVCRSPPEFKMMPTSELSLSVPLGIALVEEDFEPWTESMHRFRFYNQPKIVRAEPDEVKVGKMAEIYLIADENSEFFEPVPTQQNQIGQYGIECKFGRFGIGMGFFVNKTAIKCLTPSISDDPEDIWRETVKITLALNGQDFDEETSEADLTFVGTGSEYGFWPFIMSTLLIGLLLVALFVYCSAYFNKRDFEQEIQQRQSATIGRQRVKPYVIRDPYDQFTSRAYSAGMMGRPSSSRADVVLGNNPG